MPNVTSCVSVGRYCSRGALRETSDSRLIYWYFNAEATLNPTAIATLDAGFEADAAMNPTAIATLDAGFEADFVTTSPPIIPLSLDAMYDADSSLLTCSCEEKLSGDGGGSGELTGSELAFLLREPTGYHLDAGSDGRAQSEMSFDDATRTFSIAPKSGFSQFRFFIFGQEFVINTVKSIQISDVERLHFIYFDVDGELHELVNPTEDEIHQLIYGKGFTAIVYWDVDNQRQIYLADERHQDQMSGADHLYHHLTNGSQYLGGFGLLNFVADGNGDDDSAAQFALADGRFADEDIYFTINNNNPQQMSPIAQLPVYYLTGAYLWRRKDADNFPVIYDGSGGWSAPNGRCAYNYLNNTGSTVDGILDQEVGLRQVPQSDFFLIHVFATNDINSPIIAVLGQDVYASTSKARTGATSEINTLITVGLPFVEFVPIGSVIYQTRSNYNNVPAARIRTTDEGGDYVVWAGSGVTPAAAPTVHGLLGGLQDDDHMIYRHIDGRRDYRQFQVVHNSTGATIPALKVLRLAGLFDTDTVDAEVVTALTDAPLLGVTSSSFDNNTSQALLARGLLDVDGFDVSGGSVFDAVYMSDTGDLTLTDTGIQLGVLLDNTNPGKVFVDINNAVQSSGGGGSTAFSQYCLEFDGANSYVNLQQPSALDFVPDADEFTIMCWVRLRPGDSGAFVSKSYWTNDRQFQLDVYNDRVSCTVGGGSAHVGDATIADNEWHHIALVNYDDNGTLRNLLYVDGVVDSSGSKTSGGNMASNCDVLLGARRTSNNNGIGYLVATLVDDVAFFDAALDATEIAEAYNSGTANDLRNHSLSANLVAYYRMGDNDTYPDIMDVSGNNLNGTMVNMIEFDIVNDAAGLV